MRQTSPIRTLIVDNHQVVREALHTALDLAGDILIVGEVDSGEDALQKVDELTPDIVFMEARMPGMSGIEATTAIRQRSPSTRVILVTADESRTTISEAIQAGVSGYLLRDTSAEELMNAARLALEGKAVIHPRLTRAFIEEVRLAEKRVDTPPLSRREKELLQRVAFGATTNSPASRRPMVGFRRYRASLRRSEAWPFLRALLLVMLAVVLVAVALSMIQSGT